MLCLSGHAIHARRPGEWASEVSASDAHSPSLALENTLPTMVHDLGTSVTRDTHSLLAMEWAPIPSPRLCLQNLNLDRIKKKKG